MIARPGSEQWSVTRLSETAMLIYVYIRSHPKDDLRLREVQRAMGFASPSSALFHLQKLETAGLILKDPMGNYRVKTRVRVGLFRNYLFIRGLLVPRHALYAGLMTIASILYLTLLRQFLASPLTLIVLILNAASALLFWYESWQDWKMRPRFSSSSGMQHT